MGEWKHTPLSEVADLLPGYAFKGMDFGVGTSRGVKIKDVQTGVVAVESLDALDVTSYNQERIKKYRLNAGDHLITMTGNLGRVATIPDSPNSIYLNQRVAKLLPKANVVEDFLLYVIKSSDFIDYCVTHADSETAQPNISTGTILEYEFSLPSEDEQRAIASVLSSLDAKIDLLHRQNKTLEGMAEALFRQWFVEEEGWEEGRLGDIIEIHDSKRVPLSSLQRADMQTGKLYPYYGAATIMDQVNDFLFDGEYILLGEDGTVVTEEGFPVLQYATGKFWVNNHAHVIQAKPPYSNRYLWTYLKRQSIADIVTGAVQPKISQGNLKALPIVLPPTEVVDLICAAIAPLYAKLDKNIEQTKTLTALRDTLLPKLMSGEVRVFMQTNKS